MTPFNKVRKLVLLAAKRDKDLQIPDTLDTDDDIEQAYEILTNADAHWDYESEIREGQIETEIKCDWSRHYESKSVASQLSDGSWVGWTYWYGGGKHGEPEAIDWMEEAYDLTCEESQQMVTIRKFKKTGAKVKK
jgi:hypothetical protein